MTLIVKTHWPNQLAEYAQVRCAMHLPGLGPGIPRDHPSTTRPTRMYADSDVKFFTDMKTKLLNSISRVRRDRPRSKASVLQIYLQQIHITTMLVNIIAIVQFSILYTYLYQYLIQSRGNIPGYTTISR